MRNLILTMGFSLVLFLLAGLRAADAETVASGGLALTVDEAGRAVRLEVGAKDVTAAAAPRTVRRTGRRDAGTGLCAGHADRGRSGQRP